MYVSNHTAILAIDQFLKHNKLWDHPKDCNPSEMHLFNFYGCVSCSDDDPEKYSIEFTLYPHETFDDESLIKVFQMSTVDFIKVLEDAISNHVEMFDLKTSNLEEICK